MSVIQPDIHGEWNEIKEAIENAIEDLHGMTLWETDVSTEVLNYSYREYTISLRTKIVVKK